MKSFEVVGDTDVMGRDSGRGDLLAYGGDGEE